MEECKKQKTTIMADYGPFANSYFIHWNPENGFDFDRTSGLPLISAPRASEIRTSHSKI